MTESRRLSLVLGFTQTLAWATTFYIPAIIVGPAASTMGESPTILLGGFSWSLLIAGLASPRVGSWIDRAGRFRSLGDGEVDSVSIFSKLAQYDYPGWAVLEWECALKHPEDGAREGAPFIRDHIIRVSDRAFDDFAGGGGDDALNRALLGL